MLLYFPTPVSLSNFSFNAPASTAVYSLSLHDALPISSAPRTSSTASTPWRSRPASTSIACSPFPRSEEHTSELQSRVDLVCRLLLEKKKNVAEKRRVTLPDRAVGILRCANTSRI